MGCQVSLCGHCVHPGCFDEFFAGIVAQRHARSSLDTSRGEYYCPLCKAVCNAAVPVVERIKIDANQPTYTSFEALLSSCRGKTLKAVAPLVEEAAAKSMSLSRFSQPLEEVRAPILLSVTARCCCRLLHRVSNPSFTRHSPPDKGTP